MNLFDRIVVAVSAAAIAAAVVLGQLAARGHDLVTNTPLCWSQIFLGRECPGCGLTRSFLMIGRGAVRDANVMNPLGPILFAWLIALIAIRAGRALAPRFRWWREMDVAFGASVVMALVVRTITFYA